MAARELLMNSLIAVLGLTPIVALTVIAYRSRRTGWWLAAPWLLLGMIWLALLQLFYSMGLTQGGEGRSALVGSGFLASWLSMSIFLIALTLAGPKLPPPGVVLKK